MLRNRFKSIRWVSESLYNVLLLAYPATYRREYGPLMAQLFRDLCRDSYRQRGGVGIVRLWCHVLTDTVVTATVEHFYLLKEGGRMMTRKQHWMVLLLAGLPLLLGLFLYLINPAFMGKVFASSTVQPVGWLMTAAVFILVGTAYFIQRRIIVMSQLPDSSGQAVGGRVSLIAWMGQRGREFLFVGSMLFLVLPAVLLVLFGPAIVTVLEVGL